ncbi:Calcium/calmodulin-dependent 3',5'-cyclic nucleotide phosphodiesterase 1-like 1 [Homarus americanus]|uniref:Calcium/calmodulin-dependent 3',5'-cyclic nucleotide phosphodiesterase 1-like 1 n=1 Tax=Homarus americanus TaxID=6706 RepID=A0A8J5MSU5_HOMAM|nr:Calcium/calmodulin-dependent 3',5'-cyclic nucleotide phosphodiesterase 1-like 1 [Homarus americanus]
MTRAKVQVGGKRHPYDLQERIHHRFSSTIFLQKLPPEVTKIPTKGHRYHLQSVDDWQFDVEATRGAVITHSRLRCLAYELLNRYGLLHKFKVSFEYCTVKDKEYDDGQGRTLGDFVAVKCSPCHPGDIPDTSGNYCKYKNPTITTHMLPDVLQTMHHMPPDRPMTIKCRRTHNALVNLSREEYRPPGGSRQNGSYSHGVASLSRSRIGSIIPSPDHQPRIPPCVFSMRYHSLDKAKALSLVLHCCDISHPSKSWDLHERWTKQLLEEFFRQGDKERELGLPYSPLCDRNNTLVAESQIGFIDFIVDPSLGVCGDLLDKVASLSAPPATPTISEEPQNEPGGPIKRPVRPGGVVGTEVRRPWQDCLSANKSRWKERAMKDAELRAEMALRNEKVNGNSADDETHDDAIKEEDEKENEEASDEVNTEDAE